MKISSQQLINLPVETESGQSLGVVESFNIDIDSQSILEYVIKPASKILELIKNELIISRGQVVSITAEKIIVDDNSLKEKLKDKITSKLKEKIPSNITAKEEKK